MVSVSDGFNLEGIAVEVALAVMAWAARRCVSASTCISAAQDRVEADADDGAGLHRRTPSCGTGW